MAYVNVYSSRINWENEPNISTPLNATNLNKMDYALYQMDGTFATWDTTKADESDLLLCVKSIAYDTDTGVFVFTWQNGTTYTVDLNIEKIPVSFSMDANGVITMTTDDGSTYTADVGSLIKTYTFTDSNEIDFTVTTDADGNKTVTAGIVAGSIDGTKLVPNYLADCQNAKTGAETAEGNAEDSAEDAEAWAVGERNGVPVTSGDPTYENNSKYWASQAPSNSLATLTDVTLTSPTIGQVLTYDGSVWINDDASAGGGSTIEVTTTESTLYGQSVTLTDGVTTYTETFDNAGLATFTGVTLTGNVTISSSTATTSLNMPYFGNYSAVLSFFTATITVTYPSNATCTCVGGGESYTAVSSPHAFTVHSANTFTITATIDGVSKTASATITTDGQSKAVTITFGEIDLTYDANFVGATITCTDGITTITKTAPSGSTMAFYPPNTGTWTISSTYSGTTHSTTATVSDLSVPVSATLQTIPDGSTVTPTDDIQTWLACAGITNLSYTTVAEVLADSTTLLALMSDSNAVDYLVRSTTWASDITADSTAMTDIGSNDYCADTLLADNTWLTAICNSTYFESVLNVKVPTMTSATTPSGEVGSSSNYSGSYPAWHAFDGQASTLSSGNGWIPGDNNAICWYHFTSDVSVKKAYIDGTAYGAATDYTLVASTDGTTWVDVETGNVARHGTSTCINDSNSNEYPYWGVRIATYNDSDYGFKFQFYGRASS